MFSYSPAVVEQAFKAEAVSQKSEPQQMAVYSSQFMPHCSEEVSSFRNFQAQSAFDRMNASPAVSETADSADSFNYIHHFGEFFLFHQLFQTSMDKSDRRNGFKKEWLQRPSRLQ